MSADPDRVLLDASVAFGDGSYRGQRGGGPRAAARPALWHQRSFVDPGGAAGLAGEPVLPAPWPMPVAAIIAAAGSRRTEPSALDRRRLRVGIGTVCVLGTAVEPRHSLRLAHLVMPGMTRLCDRLQPGGTSTALIVAGWRHLAHGCRAKASRPLNQATLAPDNVVAAIAAARPALLVNCQGQRDRRREGLQSQVFQAGSTPQNSPASTPRIG